MNLSYQWWRLRNALSYRHVYWTRFKRWAQAHWCVVTGGHRWSPILLEELPRINDRRRFSASVRCERCRLFLCGQSDVANIMLNQSVVGYNSALDYAKEMLLKRLCREIGWKGLPIYYNFDEWMYARDYRRLH